MRVMLEHDGVEEGLDNMTDEEQAMLILIANPPKEWKCKASS